MARSIKGPGISGHGKSGVYCDHISLLLFFILRNELSDSVGESLLFDASIVQAHNCQGTKIARVDHL